MSDFLLHFIKSFLGNKLQRVLLKGLTSEWLPIKPGVPGFIFGPIYFLIFIHDFSDDIVSPVKLFADGTFPFSVVHYYINISASQLNNDLQRI